MTLTSVGRALRSAARGTSGRVLLISTVLYILLYEVGNTSILFQFLATRFALWDEFKAAPDGVHERARAAYRSHTAFQKSAALTTILEQRRDGVSPLYAHAERTKERIIRSTLPIVSTIIDQHRARRTRSLHDDGLSGAAAVAARCARELPCKVNGASPPRARRSGGGATQLVVA